MALDPQTYTVAGSEAAEDALAAVVKPLVGAAPHDDLTTAELNQRFDGTGDAPAHTFPTAQ